MSVTKVKCVSCESTYYMSLKNSEDRVRCPFCDKLTYLIIIKEILRKSPKHIKHKPKEKLQDQTLARCLRCEYQWSPNSKTPKFCPSCKKVLYNKWLEIKIIKVK